MQVIIYIILDGNLNNVNVNLLEKYVTFLYLIRTNLPTESRIKQLLID